MFAVCIEASHQRGLGHLFRALNLVGCFRRNQVSHIVLVNDDPTAAAILRERQVPWETVPLRDHFSGWEKALIGKHGIRIWINDRLDTDLGHASAVKACGAKLVTFDDRGSGAAAADLHIAALAFEGLDGLRGHKVLHGAPYLVLSPEIEKYKRLRTRLASIVVSMGGTDTYGVTVKAVETLRRLGTAATVILGPGFQHRKLLSDALSPAFVVKEHVPSLAEEFSRHDLAITGGGLTAFEANAAGLPSLIIANEWFEVPAAQYLERLGSSVFVGHYSVLEEARPGFRVPEPLGIESMSRAGLERLPKDGLENVYRELQRL